MSVIFYVNEKKEKKKKEAFDYIVLNKFGLSFRH